METETASDTSTMDMDAISDQIGASLFGPDDVGEPITTDETPTAETTIETPTHVTSTETSTTPILRSAPKAWPKDMHEHWGKVDPKVQDYLETREKQMLDGLDQYKGDAQYGKSFRETLSPYLPALNAAGMDPSQVVGNLLNAQWKLTQGTAESRKTAYEQLGKDLGLAPSDPSATPMDPALKAFQDRIAAVESSVMSSQQAAFTAARDRTMKEVEAFASDTTAHPHFEIVADDIAALLQAKLATSLQDAYEQAVRRNPMIFEQEKTRLQTEAVEKFKENARLGALPKKKAASVNVHSRETQVAPTEPLGSMEDTIRASFRARTGATH